VLDRELDDDYFKEAYGLLAELKSDGMLISAKFGNYNQGVGYVLRRNIEKSYFKWHLAPSYTIAPRDDSAADDLAARRERAINESANVLAQSAEHIKGFFENLRDELAFYIGCLNLYDVLKEKEIKICFPEASLPKQRNFSGLVDISLSIMIGKKAVGNRLEAYGKNFYIITGANQGGKSTFLRSIGQAQLMYQCGMFVAADYFSAPVFTGIFTHFKKEEDSRIKSGKLDEELSRMNGIADRLTSGSLVLFNESFAATNEREGAEICRQITKALSESGVEIFFVTHNYTFTEQYRKDRLQYVMFLRAGRNPDGTRTFLIEEGDPLKTAYGEDLCKGIFD
jgi:DNA mismatch repair ATPase MutS